MTRDYKGYHLSTIKYMIETYGGIRAAARALNEMAGKYEPGILPTVTESGIRMFLKEIDEDEYEAEEPLSIFCEEAEPPKPKQKKVDTRPIASGTIAPPDARRKHLTGKRFVFTSAQNNTLVHENFLASLLAFCKYNEAELIVSRFTYNKSGFQNNTKESGDSDLWYDKRLTEFFVDESVQVARELIFCGELDILPTARQPLSGFESYTQGCSGIIPHAKMNMLSLPRLKGESPRFLYTTGALTQRNYIQRKAGQKAEFHHVFGALYVEIDEIGTWFVRQLIADNNGEFYDLTNKYTPDAVETGHTVEAINYGDIHIEKMDTEVYAASWGNPDSLASVLQPTFQFIHDLTDFTSRNHHNINDTHFRVKHYLEDNTSVEEELIQSAVFLQEIEKYGYVVVVESNHNQAYQKWLAEADIRKDALNAEFFHRSNARLYQAYRENETEFSIYEWALRAKVDLCNVIFLAEDESFIICNDETIEVEENRIVGGIECGLHGHRGPNGARGNSKQFKNIGRKVNLGHSHSAGIMDGVYVAGVSGKLDMDYNKGPSTWSHSHIVTYPNGKRTIITIKNGKWRA